MGVGQIFERELAKGLQRQFPYSFVHRFKQTQQIGVKQPFDVEIIWPYKKSVLIECKSKDVSGRKTITLPQLYNQRWPEQYEKQIAHIERTELIGVFSFEWRWGRGKGKRAFYIPLSSVRGKTVSVENPDAVEIKREGSIYQVPAKFPET